MPELEGRIALVTGGSRGIGRAIALALAGAGADVALSARGREALEETAGEIEALGRRSLAVPADVSSSEEVEGVFRRVVDELGTLDILVNNAGAAPFFATLDSVRLDGFEKYFRINFNGAVYCTRAAAPILLEKGAGSVINIASVAGLIGSPGLTYYASAKAALINLTKTVALEWAAAGVRVNAIAAGWIETDLNAGARKDPGFYDGIRSQIPLGRWGSAEEIASVALFLASDASSFMTGSVVVADGGQTLSSLTP